jgi:protein phosphatase
MTPIALPDFCLVVLIGATGAGKSTFAHRHFKPTEIISSDYCRGLIVDDENDQAISGDAFQLVGAIAAMRLKHRRLAVIDATNVRAADRKQWIELARRYHALPVAIVLDVSVDDCMIHNKDRPDRQFGAGVPQRMVSEIRRSQRGLEREGFRQVWRLHGPEAIAAATLSRQPLWTDKRDLAGPFDIFGDVHGCADELEVLLCQLGYQVSWTPQLSVIRAHDRTAIFVGDLLDRGPRSPDVVRIVRRMVTDGTALCVKGNHEHKVIKWLIGKDVKPSHGLKATIEQYEQLWASDAPNTEDRRSVKDFLDGLPSHLWLDGGRLAVAHAGIKAEMIGRASGAIREFTMYGETTGEIDDYGLPVRADWAAHYRGDCAVVYGHTPMREAEWVNNTMCLDTGCVFGGKLTALRWPERELVSVPAARVYYEPSKPLGPSGAGRSAQAEADDMLDFADVSGRRWIDTGLMKRIVVAEENAAAALEAMSRFAMAPQWLIHLPPTMSPVETSPRDGWLERPEEAFDYFRRQGVDAVVLEEKHMGSRAVIAVCRDADVARRRFGIVGDEAGAIWTRTGRPFFADATLNMDALSRARAAIDAAGLWEELATDWVLLDAEIMPWSAKAASLIEGQYAPVSAAALAGLGAAHQAMAQAQARGVAIDAAPVAERLERARAYEKAWGGYVWPVVTADDLRIAPFHVLASEGAVNANRDHAWHMGLADRLAAAGAPAMQATRWRRLALSDDAACADAVAWWEALTTGGGEGMVVKPLSFIARAAKGLVQPAVKVRGREYLRIIYGPEYDAPENLVRLKQRGLGGKRALALREFALGLEALERFVAGQPLRRVHECVFAVLALESEPIDPRL